MEFKNIASVTGKSGLFQIIKPTRSGVILESIDNQKLKMIINSNSKVSILKDISIYTTTSENNILLEVVMQNVHKLFNGKLDVTSKSNDTDLRAFMKKVIPTYDAERVYISDIKKLITWYTILATISPEVFEVSSVTEENAALGAETNTENENSILPEVEIVKNQKIKASKSKNSETKQNQSSAIAKSKKSK